MPQDTKKYVERNVDGTQSAFSDRQAPWNTLGVVTDTALTAQEAIIAAQLDWTVEKMPLQTIVPTATGVSTIEVPNKFAMVRQHEVNGVGIVGVVGSRYTPVQNTDAFSFCTQLVDDGDALFESAGSLGNGRKVFMTMRLPREIRIGGEDLINHYLLVTTTHDGTEPMIASITGVRFACTNQITAITRNAKTQYRFRHSTSVDGRLQDARDALKLSWKYEDEFEVLANQMLDMKMSDNEYKQFVDMMFPIKVRKDEPSKRAVTMNETLKGELMGLWRADTQANIAGSRWAAYNSVVEYVDWFTPIKGANADVRRAERAIDGKGQAVKARAFKALLPA